jgi:hypothetical protein
MKTSMEELIEVLKELEPNEDPLKVIHWDYFLNKEMMQIKEARQDGVVNTLYEKKVTHQQYFQETFDKI